ncbi:MAG: NAD(P)/FAD-dependent oxidoreductase [bacterium]
MYVIDLFVPVNKGNDIKELIAEKLQIRATDILSFKILKKSLDARNKGNIHWIYRIEFETMAYNSNFKKYGVNRFDVLTKEEFVIKRSPKESSVIIVGMGPAGIFSALSLALSGVHCTIIERGKAINGRIKDVDNFLKNRVFNEESNIQFGEGGAGTFSDGKLTARTKHPFYHFVINEFIKAGAPEEIAYLSKPHIGTDRLRKVIINLRKKLLSLGVKILFEERLEFLIIKEGVVKGVVTNKGELYSDYVVLAIGYSARDTLTKLVNQGLFIEPKGFAMGYRLELPQDVINKAMYGSYSENLPPAEFFHTKYFPDRTLSVYTFCMCPGGVVVPANSSPNQLVLNGMSRYRRDGYFGNAAIVVSYNPQMWHNKVSGGILLQQKIEEQAFLSGGANYDAPALSVTDFVNKKVTKHNFKSSYPFGLKAYPIWEFYIENYDYYRAALLDFGKKMKGLISEESLLIAPETRTSAPYRITRDENLMSLTIKNLFPSGEGAGYAGGIITSAVDGLKVAEKIKSLG